MGGARKSDAPIWICMVFGPDLLWSCRIWLFWTVFRYLLLLIRLSRLINLILHGPKASRRSTSPWLVLDIQFRVFRGAPSWAKMAMVIDMTIRHRASGAAWCGVLIKMSTLTIYRGYSGCIFGSVLGNCFDIVLEKYFNRSFSLLRVHMAPAWADLRTKLGAVGRLLAP